MAEPGRGVNIAVWVVCALMCALYLMTGYMKVTSNPQAVAAFHNYDYSDGFRMFIGTCELLGAVALLIPPLAFWSASGLFIIMLGAAHAHLTHNEASHLPVVIALLALLPFVAWVRRSRALFLS
jgi:uncharacterized membrane protein YphA (DoxX/SURF4 family)